MAEALEGEVKRILKYVLESASVTKGILKEIRILMAINGHRISMKEEKQGPREKVSIFRMTGTINLTHSQKWISRTILKMHLMEMGKVLETRGKASHKTEKNLTESVIICYVCND